MTASRATLLKKAQDLGVALPPDRMGITGKELQALIREHNAKPKQVRKSPPIDLDQDPTPDEPRHRAGRGRRVAKAAPKSSANVVSIDTAKKPAAALNRPPKSALAFKPARPGTKRALMAEAVLRPEGATLDALMNLTGWDRNTTQGAIIWDLCSQMGIGVRRDGDRYYGTLPEGVTAAVREQAPVRMAANKR
jgi:Protein of unknown function (DUF3489)